MPRTIRNLLVAVALSALFALPAPALAQDSGGTAAPTGETGGAAPVADGSLALLARRDVLLGRTVSFDGRVGGAGEGQPVTIERYDARAGVWVPVAATATAVDGTFATGWRSNHIGRFRFRAVAGGQSSQSTAARASSASPELALTIYKPATATWYGPGFYGRRTACGQRMSRKLLGVAHKQVPCGTKVALYYRGRTIVVPVVDRGPYRANTAWDLTVATAKALRMTATSRIGAVTLR